MPPIGDPPRRGREGHRPVVVVLAQPADDIGLQLLEGLDAGVDLDPAGDAGDGELRVEDARGPVGQPRVVPGQHQGRRFDACP